MAPAVKFPLPGPFLVFSNPKSKTICVFAMCRAVRTPVAEAAEITNSALAKEPKESPLSRGITWQSPSLSIEIRCFPTNPFAPTTAMGFLDFQPARTDKATSAASHTAGHCRPLAKSISRSFLMDNFEIALGRGCWTILRDLDERSACLELENPRQFLSVTSSTGTPAALKAFTFSSADTRATSNLALERAVKRTTQTGGGSFGRKARRVSIAFWRHLGPSKTGSMDDEPLTRQENRR